MSITPKRFMSIIIAFVSGYLARICGSREIRKLSFCEMAVSSYSSPDGNSYHRQRTPSCISSFLYIFCPWILVSVSVPREVNRLGSSHRRHKLQWRLNLSAIVQARDRFAIQLSRRATEVWLIHHGCSGVNLLPASVAKHLSGPT